MNKYETALLIDAKLDNKEYIKTVEKYEKMMKEFSNKEVEIEDAGIKTLAYAIKKNTQAHYVFFKYKAEPENILELERHCRIDDNILRFLTVKEEVFEHNEDEEEEEEY